MSQKSIIDKQTKPGFALVVALTLIAFVVLLLVSISAFVGVELSLASKTVLREEAKANALVGLATALGELQASAGPDQRVTAQADILSSRVNVPENYKRFTGVWKTADDTDENTVSAHANQSQYDRWAWSTTDGATNLASDGSWEHGPKWLVSSEQPFSSITGTSLDLLNPSFGTVALLASKELTSTGQPGSADAITEAGIVPFANSSTAIQPTGGYAWWVGDESVKANISLPGSKVADDLQGRIAQQKVFGRNTIEMADDIQFDWTDSDVLSEVDRIYSIDDFLSLTDNAATPDQTRFKYTDHWTTFNYGLLTNVRDGGLKKDLTAALGEEWPEELAGKPLWYVYEDGDYLKGPMWDVIYSYSNLYREKQPWLPQFFGSDSDFLISGGYNDWEPYTYVRNSAVESYAGISNPNVRNPWLDVRGPGPIPNNNTTFYPSGETYRTYGNPVRWLYTEGNQSNAGEHLDFTEVDYGSYNGSFRQEPIDYNLAPIPLGIVTRVSLAALPLSVHWDKSRRDTDINDTDGYYWSRDRLFNDFSGNDTDDLNKSMVQLAGTSLGNNLESHYALYLVIDPHVMVWNPFNVSLGPTDFEVIWLPGYKQTRGKSTIYNKDEWDFRIDADFVWDSLPYDYVPVFIPSKVEEVGGKNVDANPVFNDTFIFAGAINQNQNTSTLKHYNGLTLNMQANAMAPGEVALYAMDSADIFRTSVDLVDIESASAVRGWIRPIPSRPLPAGAKIKGMSIDLLDPSDYPSESWALQTKLEFDKIEIGNGIVSGKSRARSISHMIPQAEDGSNLITRHFDTDYNVEELVPASMAENAADLALTAEPVGFLWALSKTADTSAGGLPMFAQFNSAAAAMLNVTNGNPEPFTWSINFADPDTGHDTLGVADMLQGIVGWGSSYGTGGQESVVVYDIPRQPIMSVGELMHAGLSFLDTEPAYPLGGGYASPFIPLDKTYTVENISGPGTNDDYHLMDVAYLTNESLMDRYFFSGIPEKSIDDGGIRNISRTPPFSQEFDASYLNGSGALPNERLVLNSSEEVNDSYLDERLRDRSLAATELLINGPFNVNSTSKVAWKSVLAGFSGNPVETLLSSETISNKYVFPRFSVSAGSDGNSWSGYRTLSEGELDSLAEAIVEEVRERGPFMSMADFVNRRLERNSDRGRIAALQSAIDKTVNSNTSGLGDATNLLAEGDWLSVMDTTVLVSKQGAGAPGWLLQNDILRSLEPVLTTRSDTFRIRAYGETRNSLSGEIEGRAWCEAVVQRNPQYIGESIGGSNDPTGEAAYPVAWNNNSREWEATQNGNLGNDAIRFGREFTIVGFRWLDEAETQVLQ